MALLFDKPFPVEKEGRRFHMARLISTARGEQELVKFCRHYGIPRWAIRDGVLHIGGKQIESARLAGAKETTPQQLDKIIRSKRNG